LKQELKLLKRIISDNAPTEYDYKPEEGSRKAKQSDYKSTDVIPVSDPNASTMAQKIVQYQAVMQLAQQSPNLFNMPLLYRQMLDVLSIKDAHKLIPLPEDMKPKDPVTENQNILMMKPVKAFQYQDHTSHITVHMSAMKDPKIMQLLQNNPQAQQLQAAMMAHINEHLGFQYRVEIEKQLGMSLPPTEDVSGEEVNMDPEVEARLAPLLAQASQRLLQQNQAQVAQQQAQQQAQDPLVQMQQQELQLKAAEQQRKAQKDATDAQLKQEQLQIERSRIAANAALESAKTQAQIQAKQVDEKMKAGLDLVKHISEKGKAHDIQNKQLLTNIAMHKSEQAHELAKPQKEPKQKGE
jgi:hypothetical protein